MQGIERERKLHGVLYQPCILCRILLDICTFKKKRHETPSRREILIFLHCPSMKQMERMRYSTQHQQHHYFKSLKQSKEFSFPQRLYHNNKNRKNIFQSNHHSLSNSIQKLKRIESTILLNNNNNNNTTIISKA